MSKKGKIAASKKASAKKGSAKPSIPKFSLPIQPSKPPTSLSKPPIKHSKPSRLSNLKSRLQLIWVRFQASPYSPLPMGVIREISLYISDQPLFVLLYYSSISSFDVSLGQASAKTKIPLKVRLPSANWTYVVLDRTKVLCCGGHGKV
jgi:hypothetical protein